MTALMTALTLCVRGFAVRSWTTGNAGTSRQEFRRVLLATVRLALIGSVISVEYIDRECAVDRRVRNVSFIDITSISYR